MGEGWSRITTVCSAPGAGAEATALPNRWVSEVRLGVRARLVPFTLAASLAAAALAAAGARAETYRVTRHDDPRPGACVRKDCSLREAIRAANRDPGPDVVVLPDRRPAYRLSRHDRRAGEGGNDRGDLDLTGPVTIRHGLGGRAVIDAGGVGRVVEIHPGAPAKLARITLRGGDAAAAGGGVATAAPLRLVRAAVTGNRAGSGGGVYARARLTLMRTRVRDNASLEAGGGIDAEGARVLMIRSRATGNRAAEGGGGVALADDAFRLSKSTVGQNQAGGGGGGIQLLDARGRIAQSTVSGNAAGGSGGGLNQSGSRLEVFNSTFTRNRAGATGGGIQSSGAGGDVMLNSVTVARNVANASGGRALGGGLAARAGAVSVVNTIVSLNRSGSKPSDCHGLFVSFGGNLLGTAAGCRGFVGSALIGADPRLGRLRDNGGPTKTLALKPESPAIDQASTAREPQIDQRGRKRGPLPDIGAFER